MGCLLVVGNSLFNEMFHIDEANPPWEGEKGVSEFQKLSGQKLPSGTTCLAVHYEHWQSWRFDFLFKSPKPLATPDFSNVAPNEESYKFEDLKSVLNRLDKPFWIAHPRNLRQKEWQQKDASWVSITSIECDDGCYVFGSVFTM